MRPAIKLIIVGLRDLKLFSFWLGWVTVVASEVVDNASFFLEMRPNRSLTARGRWLWFALVGCTTLLVAGAATAIGAWVVLPFAGFEVLFVWSAFQLIGRHDDDYEWVRVADCEFCWMRYECGQVETLRGNAAWVQILAIPRKGQVEIGLRYQGRTVSVGRLISDEQRQLLLRNLARALKIGVVSQAGSVAAAVS